MPPVIDGGAGDHAVDAGDPVGSITRLPVIRADAGRHGQVARDHTVSGRMPVECDRALWTASL